MIKELGTAELLKSDPILRNVLWLDAFRDCTVVFDDDADRYEVRDRTGTVVHSTTPADVNAEYKRQYGAARQ